MEKYTAAKEWRIMSRDQVRAVDRWAIEQVGVPGVVLMENAGRSCAELVKDRLQGAAEPRVCIFCGTGNNGGDGYVIARHLINAGLPAEVVICGDRAKVRGDAKINLDILEQLGHATQRLDPGGVDVAAGVRALAGKASMIVDALFGTGLQGPLRADYQGVVNAINALGVPILSVDIPSGLDCDTGEPLGAAVQATYTVTFVAVKKGFVASPTALRYTGELYVASIGVEPPP
jgi:hydroxyethylthiazole kinase-like uncharacterized protein yjeF